MGNSLFRVARAGARRALRGLLYSSGRAKAMLYRVPIGADTLIDPGARLLQRWGGKIYIGARGWIDAGATLRADSGGRLTLGDDVLVYPGCLIHCQSGTLRIGHRVFLNIGCYLGGTETITVGDDVLFGPHVVIADSDHGYKNMSVPIARQPLERAPVRIGDGAWLGAHVTVTKGVTIGEGAIIGAGSVVRQDIPPYAIAVGVPAQIVHQRKGENNG